MRPLTAFLFPFRLILTIILSPIVTIMYAALILVIALPSQLLRKLVSALGRLLDRDLCKLVQTTASLFARDYSDWYRQPAQAVCTLIKFKGHFALSEMQQIVLNNAVYRRDHKTGQLEYPELQQYCTKRLGFLFYKWDRKFQIENHVKFYPSKKLLPDPGNCVVDDEMLRKIWEESTILPYQPKQSPWNILVVPNHRPNSEKEGGSDAEKGEIYTVIILQNAHSLMDGHSTYRFLLTLTDHGLDMWDEQVALRKPVKCFSQMLHLTAILFGPTAFLWRCLKGFDMCHPLHMPLSKKTGQSYIVTTTLKLEQVKRVRRAHLDVSFHSVLIAGLTGGIRSYLIRNGFKVPFSPIRLGIPIPGPVHSQKLRNEFLISCLDLPVHKRTARERLLAVEKSIQELKTGPVTPFAAQTVMFLGGFPLQCIRRLTSLSGVSVMYSEMKGPEIPLTAANGKHEMESLMFTVPLGTDDLGVSFSSISYFDKIYFVLSVDKGVAKNREKAEELMYYIEKEIEALRYGDSTNL